MKAPRRARRIAGDPFARSVVLSIVLIAAGFVAIGLGWRGAARSVIVAEQLPFLISGGVGGLALIVAGAGVLVVQSSRYHSAREQQRIDRLVVSASRPFPAEGSDGELSQLDVAGQGPTEVTAEHQ